jgi:hypothetical protein
MSEEPFCLYQPEQDGASQPERPSHAAGATAHPRAIRLQQV